MSNEENNKHLPAITGDAESLEKEESSNGTLELILKSLKEQATAQRLAFEMAPNENNQGEFSSLYTAKTRLTPDHILKGITGPGGDELLNQILQARSNVIGSFGRPRTDRFSVGFEFVPMNADDDKLDDPNKSEEVKEQIHLAKEVLWNCGYKGLEEDFPPNLSQTLKMITRDGLTFGRCAIEMIYIPDKANPGQKKPHSFRAVDAGTIYRIKPKAETQQDIRQQAIKLLQELKNEKIDPSKYEQDAYRWVQVVEGKPVQAFTAEELIVYNFYPVTNIDYSGYPLTPIDQALSAIITHINISLHNRLYFQNGRATRGMLVFNSDSMDETAAQKIRLQFHQTINNVNNSWRMPVFVVGQEEKVSWQQMDAGGRDAEFQFLMDNNSRIIMGAFQMSPDELPGYNHLSRGTNTQSLSESNNAYQLTASRDSGLRPLIYDIQDLLNTHIFPRFFHSLSKTHQLVLSGLDKDDPEKEATRLATDIPLHMTYNDVLKKVEKDVIPQNLGGEYPLNPQFQQVLEKYLSVGQIMESFFGIQGASTDPRFAWYRDPLWMQREQILIQQAQIAMQNQQIQQQMQQQQQMAQMQAQNPQPEDGEEPQQEDAQKTENLMFELMQKNIKSNHNTISQMILARHNEVAQKHAKAFEEDSKKAAEQIINTITKPKKKK